MIFTDLRIALLLYIRIVVYTYAKIYIFLVTTKYYYLPYFGILNVPIGIVVPLIVDKNIPYSPGIISFSGKVSVYD